LAALADPRERAIAEAAFFFGVKAQLEPEHVVVLVHGINTDAEWQEALADQIRTECGLNTYVIGYGNYNPVHFLWPYWDMRTGPIERVIGQLRVIRAEKPGARISVIAHSFGTYIMSKILSECADLSFHRIQLCGAVVEAQFKWELVRGKFTQLVNDVGTRDVWPILAKQSTWGYGDGGAFGFKNTVCHDRHFNYEHSDFMTPEHFSKFWKPYLVDGEIVTSSWTKQRKAAGWKVKLLRMLPAKYFLWWLIIPLVTLLIGGGVAWSVTRLFKFIVHWAGLS
jgi:pimeloyl-ACP methyl ester carboxylesterase